MDLESNIVLARQRKKAGGGCRGPGIELRRGEDLRSLSSSHLVGHRPPAPGTRHPSSLSGFSSSCGPCSVSPAVLSDSAILSSRERICETAVTSSADITCFIVSRLLSSSSWLRSTLSSASIPVRSSVDLHATWNSSTLFSPSTLTRTTSLSLFSRPFTTP